MRRLALEHAADDGAVDEALIERAAAQVHRLLGDVALRADRLWRDDPRDAEARRQRLREAREVHHAAGGVVGLDRPRLLGGRGVGKIQVAVRIVLDDEHVGALGPVEQLAALLEADQQAGRILEVRDQIQQTHAASVRPGAR